MAVDTPNRRREKLHGFCLGIRPARPGVPYDLDKHEKLDPMALLEEVRACADLNDLTVLAFCPDRSAA